MNAKRSFRRSTKLGFVLILLCLIISNFGSIEYAEAAPGNTTRVSVDSSGVQGNNWSMYPSLSANGRYVAFQSSASNLVNGDSNGVWDVFLRDTQTNVTTRVSVDSNGAQGNNDSWAQSISADGRYVAFQSSANNLVSGDTNGAPDIFLRDTQMNTTTRISLDSNGAQGNDLSEYTSISADGRYVAFESFASNLVSGDTNGGTDIFVRDTHMNTTTRVSVSSSGAEGTGAEYPSISADGRYVTFWSYSSNLVSGDTNGTTDIFMRDMQTNTTTRVSVSSSGMEGNSYSDEFSSISADGRYVAFESYASNLVSGDTNGTWDIFVRDTQTSTTTRISVASSGVEGNGLSMYPSMSTDGRYVAFSSEASNLASGDNNGWLDVFVRDMQTNTTTLVSLDSNGAQGNEKSGGRSFISANGRYVAFESSASNLVSDDTNGVLDVFVHENDISIVGQSFTISGTTGVGSTTLSYIDGNSKTATADANGNYSFSIPSGWSGTVSPSKTSYTFSPLNRVYANVQSDQVNQNYTATSITYVISGNVGVANATLSYTDGIPKAATSVADGSYSFTVSSGWSGTVTPSKSSYTFSPSNRVYANVQSDQINQNYTPTLQQNCTPTDPLWGKQWDMLAIDLVGALNQFPNCQVPSINIAVVDSGVDISNIELAGRILNISKQIQDTNGHGTFVAGTIVAIQNNGVGVAGIHPNAQLSVYKISKFPNNFNLAQLIRTAVDNGARVINLSLGNEKDPFGILEGAVNYAENHNPPVIIVAGAADLNHPSGIFYPAFYASTHNNVIAVTSSTYFSQIATYALPGNYLTIAAPGGEGAGSKFACLSTLDDCIFGLGLTLGKKSNYVENEGISMAVPHVTGVVALMLSVNPNLTPAQIRTILKSTASPLAVQNNSFPSIGIINASKAVECARQPSTPACNTVP